MNALLAAWPCGPGTGSAAATDEVQLVFELEHQALDDLRADAADALEARLVAAIEGVGELARAEAAHDAQGQLGPDAVDPEQGAKGRAVFEAGEAVERERVLAHLGVHVQGDALGSRGQAAQGAQRDEDLVAHARDVDHAGPVEGLIHNDTGESPDHVGRKVSPT